MTKNWKLRQNYKEAPLTLKEGANTDPVIKSDNFYIVLIENTNQVQGKYVMSKKLLGELKQTNNSNLSHYDILTIFSGKNITEIKRHV